MNTWQLLIVALLVLTIAGTILAMIRIQIEDKRRRMQAIIRGHSSEKHDSSGLGSSSVQDRRRAELAKKLKESGDLEKNAKRTKTLHAQIEQAGLSLSLHQYFVFSFVQAGLVGLLSKIFGAPTLLALLIGACAFFLFPHLFLKFKAKRRQKKFLEDFADALEAMVRLLKAGMPVSEAVHMASREFTGPVGEEMARMYDSQRIGVSLPEAALAAARRMPIAEMNMFATAVNIQAQTGSSLSDVLTSLASLIRARFRLQRKVQALSAEAKVSAAIIGALPIFVATGMWFVNRDYINVLFQDQTGNYLLWITGAWMTIGILIMRGMINFRI